MTKLGWLNMRFGLGMLREGTDAYALTADLIHARHQPSRPDGLESKAATRPILGPRRPSLNEIGTDRATWMPRYGPRTEVGAGAADASLGSGGSFGAAGRNSFHGLSAAWPPRPARCWPAPAYRDRPLRSLSALDGTTAGVDLAWQACRPRWSPWDGGGAEADATGSAEAIASGEAGARCGSGSRFATHDGCVMQIPLRR